MKKTRILRTAVLFLLLAAVLCTAVLAEEDHGGIVDSAKCGKSCEDASGEQITGGESVILSAPEDLPGDMNGDGVLDLSDAFCLLRHSLLPDRYGISRPGDVNGDGRVDSADAIRLLRHILDPSRYPLFTGPNDTTEEKEKMTLTLKINDTPVSVDWEENASTEALLELVKDQPLTIRMSMYGGFEQVGPIGRSLPRDDRQTTTHAGDIVLYSGNRIVVFYGSNSWAYTPLGHITDKNAEELAELLGNGDVTVTLSAE